MAMKLRIRAPEGMMTGALRAHVERRLGLALGRFADRIGTVAVRFSMKDGHTSCQIDVALCPRVVRVEDEATDPSQAAEHAIGRVGGPVERAIQRQHQS
jgi:ribosome-associated translation inhibitor RaiA